MKLTHDQIQWSGGASENCETDQHHHDDHDHNHDHHHGHRGPIDPTVVPAAERQTNQSLPQTLKKQTFTSATASAFPVVVRDIKLSDIF
ncbi:hypothetical protein FF1_021672 [Malus domestica]